MAGNLMDRKAAGMAGQPIAAAPSPVQAALEWRPLKSGGANFQTHKLVVVGLDRVEFCATVGLKVFCAIFTLLGFGGLLMMPAMLVKLGLGGFNPALLIPLLVGGVFMAVGIGMYRSGSAPIVFDRRKGLFWKGRVAPDAVLDKRQIKDLIALDDIVGLQIITERVRGNKSSYNSYELNLVLKDGERINVVDHGGAAKLRADARELGVFLDKPVWDGPEQ